MDDAESGTGLASGSLPTGFESAIAESAIGESAPAPAAAAPLPRPLLALAVFLLFLLGMVWFVRTRPPARPAHVPGDAIRIDGVWISCRAGGSATEWECLVFSDNGALLHSGIYRGLIGTAGQPHITSYCDGRLGTLEGVFLQEIPPTPMAATPAGADTSAWPPRLSHGYSIEHGGCLKERDTMPFHLTDNDYASDTVTPTDTIVIATTPLPDGVDTVALLALIPTENNWRSTGETELPDGTIQLSSRGYQLSDFNIPERYHQLPETFERRAREEAIVIVLLTTIDTSTVLARVCTPKSRDSLHMDLVVFRKEDDAWRAYGAGSVFTLMIRCNG